MMRMNGAKLTTAKSNPIREMDQRHPFITSRWPFNCGYEISETRIRPQTAKITAQIFIDPFSMIRQVSEESNVIFITR
jgi:hypothetical protein